MFYYISGTLAALENDFAVVDAGGVGYKLNISGATYAELVSRTGSTVTLFTHLNVREDAMELYGFPTEDELDVFKALISVSGIGPKGAIAILGIMTADELLAAVASDDAKKISRAPGVGLKTAQKVCIELKGKAKRMGVTASPDAPAVRITGELATVVDTLMVYGFKREQIEKALTKVDTSLSTEEILGQTLRVLGSM